MRLPPKSALFRKGLPLLFCVAGGVALACGPDFPTTILKDRAGTLTAPPRNSFAFEAGRLVPAQGIGKAVEPGFTYFDSKIGKDVRSQPEVEHKGLSAAQVAEVDAMRRTGNAEAALRLVKSLPPAVAVYTAGAVEFQAKRYLQARQRFDAVLAMPPNTRTLWAAYSAARADAALGNADKAMKGFAAVRTLAAKGAPDNFGFAVASLGEEARLHFVRALDLLAGPQKLPGMILDPPPPDEFDVYRNKFTLPRAKAVAYGRAMRAAARLYAAQAAHKSGSGTQSLRLMAESILVEPARLNATIRDPLLQRVLVAYVLSREQYWYDEDRNTKSAMVQVLDALARAGVEQPAEADRLAALAYRAGRFERAGRMAATSDSAMALWVRARLDVRAGDLAAARRSYAAAIAAAAGNLQEGKPDLLAVEDAALAQAQGHYVEALRLFHGVSDYWHDTVFIAERVLTTDELKALVDGEFAARSEDCVPGAKDTVYDLHDVLARRLARENRLAEAIPYYCSDKIRAQAQRYLDLLNQKEDGTPRAHTLYRAAMLARDSGMEIMGTELSPDFTSFNGNFDLGREQFKAEDKAFVTEDERHRAQASAPSPDFRFHYRFVAARHAIQAADLLPRKSQAFAAALCNAAAWSQSVPEGRKQSRDIYNRCVREGAAMPWADHFGWNCPAPNFSSATR